MPLLCRPKTPNDLSYHLLTSADQLFDQHQQLKLMPQYEETFKTTKALMVGKLHFSKDRTDDKLNAIEEMGEELRQEMATQKKSGVDRTAESQGYVKYTNVKKGDASNGFGHQKELREELEYRGLTSKEIDDLFASGTWSGKVLPWLTDHEIERVTEESNGDDSPFEQAKKY